MRFSRFLLDSAVNSLNWLNNLRFIGRLSVNVLLSFEYFPTEKMDSFTSELFWMNK